MKNDRNQFIHQTAKAAVITTVALALTLPGGLASAADASYSTNVTAVQAPSVMVEGQASTADTAKAKVTQEQAVAKLRALFPVLKDANVSNAQIGTGNSYPVNPNRLVWNIQWNYQVGSSGYGFTSEVDAITGDLISTYLYFPVVQANNYYPPKLSRTEALEKAKSFIAAAAPSLKSSQLEMEENTFVNESALFGPVQYSFSFKVLINGLPSNSESVQVTVDGSGNIIQFNKSYFGQTYPSAKPAVTEEQAEKKFTEGFDIGLYYTPVYKKGVVDSWVVGWKAQEEALYTIDAQTGKRLDSEGKDAGSTPIAYEAIPAGKDVFQPVSTGKELTADEAVKRVQQVATIPENRKLDWQTLNSNYQNGKQKVWSLAWGDTTGAAFSGMPGRTYAEVNAVTGEVLQFQAEQYSYMASSKAQQATAVPAGTKKLSQAEAKQQAISLINRLYSQAGSVLKLAEHGGTWSVLPDGKGYRYQFIRYYEDIPVSNSMITLELDSYGKLLTYMNYGYVDFSKINKQPAPVVTKAEALKKFLNTYTLKLQYSLLGGSYGINAYVEPKVKLVYAPQPADITKPYEVLNAQTGEWSSAYELYGQVNNSASAVDVKGHAAEQQLTELLKYGVMAPDADGKINPDQEITVGEWLDYIAKASTPYYTQYSSSAAEHETLAGVTTDSPYYDAVSFGVTRNWLDKDAVIKPEEKISREELAVLLSSFLKYSKLTAFLGNDSTLSSFSDSSAISNKGAVALVVRLGLMQGENGKFNPQQHVTKAQAASIIMKLVELQGKTDQVIGLQ